MFAVSLVVMCHRHLAFGVYDMKVVFKLIGYCCFDVNGH